MRPSFSNRGINVTDDHLLEAYGQIEAQLESRPWKPYRQILRECVAGLGLRYNFSPTALEMDALPASLPFWPAFPDTVEALRRLKPNYKLAIISNTDDDLFSATARNLGIEFDSVITAEQCRSYKPSHKNSSLQSSDSGFRASRSCTSPKASITTSCRPARSASAASG